MASLKDRAFAGLSAPETRAAAPGASPLASAQQFLRRLLLSEYFILYLIIVYFFVLAPFFPTLTTPFNLSNQLSNIWPLLAIAVGQTFVLIIAGIDLSQGSVMALTSVIGAAAMATAASADVLSNSPLWGWAITEAGGFVGQNVYSVVIGVLLMLIVGALIGFFNGVAIAHFNMPAFMVTLVSLTFFSAFAIYITQSENIEKLPDAYIQLGDGDIVSLYFGEKVESQLPRREVYSFVTYPAVIAIGLAVVAHVILSRTVVGKYIYAIGTNRKAAEISGVPTRQVIILVYMFSGMCAAVGAILYSARLGAGRPTLGAGTALLDIIGATVIGGTSLFGGKGKVLWTVSGVIFFILLANSLYLMNLSAFQIDMVKGAVILAAALIDVLRRRLVRER